MGKKWVIPDIHGCAVTLKTLFEDHIKPAAGDTIFFLGDYIDRGPGSKEVLDFIMDLQQSPVNVIPLIGNHEEYMLKTFYADRERGSFLGVKTKTGIQKNWEMNGGAETLKSLDIKWPSEIPIKYIDWIGTLPLYQEADRFLLVHAGFNFEADDPLSDRQAMLWTKDYEIKPEKINYRTIIHGHVPVSLEFIDRTIKAAEQPFIDLDNGVYLTRLDGFGNLIALELTEMKYVVQPTLDVVDSKYLI